MKRITILLFATAISFQVFSQTSDLKYGVRFALGQSMFSDNLGGSSQLGRIAFNIGITTHIQFTNSFATSVDLHLCSKGTRISGTDESTSSLGVKTSSDYLRTFRLFYAEFPILPRYTISIKEKLKLNIFAGPSINFAVISATESKDGGTNSYSSNDIANVKTIEYAAVTGFSFNVTNSDLHQYFLDFRYSIPLSSVATISGKEISISYFAVGVGFLY